MKVKDSPRFNHIEPENFTWQTIKSSELKPLCGAIARHIGSELDKPAHSQLCLLGLRRALLIIADFAEA